MPAPAPMQRKAIALIFVTVLSVTLMVLPRLDLRLLPAGDEGGEPVDVALRRVRGMLRTRRVGLLLAHRIGLRLTRLISLLLAHRKRLWFAWQIGLRLAGAERHLAGA